MTLFRNILVISAIIVVIIGIQVIFSTRKRAYIGLIIPLLNLIGAIVFASFATNYASAFLAFIIGSIPWALNLLIFLICRYFMKCIVIKKSKHAD